MEKSNSPACPFETIAEGETEQIAETTDLTVKLLDKRYTSQQKKILRGVHPKSHGCVKATFTINSDLDEDLRVGLFANPGKKFDAIIRFSTANVLVTPDIDPDGDHGSRGMAIKVFNVEGEMLLDDHGANNQDFLMLNQPVFAFANTEDYLRLSRIIHRHNDDPENFFAPLKLQDPSISEELRQQILAYIAAENIAEDDIKRILDTFKIVKKIKASGIANPLQVQYFSAAPFLFGPDRIMKFSAKPKTKSTSSIPRNPGDNYLHDALIKSLQGKKNIVFDFMVQITRFRDDLGIENASTLWDEKKYPFISVAKINIPAPQTDIDSRENLQHCENLALTPWHSLAAHQPIGSINRLRKPVYQASANHRLIDEEEILEQDFPFIIKIFQKLLTFLFGN